MKQRIQEAIEAIEAMRLVEFTNDELRLIIDALCIYGEEYSHQEGLEDDCRALVQRLMPLDY
jgi:hypothetical protein